ncbi:MAG: tRNA pseudouridine(38-40) synthase TruA [Pseudohongiellaceae bacterium]|jgi:tRNA pseudouridine38-40 synthase
MTETTSAGGDSCRVALGIEYNGRGFNGWQAQKSPHTKTVQQTLEQALSEVADHPVTLVCAGRTDAGVHATGQVVHFDHRHERTEGAWIRGGNALLPPEVSVRWAKQVPADFHARFSATARRYRYVIYNHAVKPAILNGQVTHHYQPLDAERMHAAGQLLLGEQDFSAYRGAACQSTTPMRHVSEISVRRQWDFVTLDIQANAFLLHMVRNIAGVLMEIGEGRKPVAWAGEVLAGRDRRQGGVTALPNGLYLVRVFYPAAFNLPEVAASPGFLLS